MLRRRGWDLLTICVLTVGLAGCSPVPARVFRPQDWFKKETPVAAAPAKKAPPRPSSASIKRVESSSTTASTEGRSAAPSEPAAKKTGGIPMARDVGL